MDKQENLAFATPEIGVGAIVFNNDNAVLLIKRNQQPALGQWSVPGGKLEPGESVREACSREVKEETGLHIRVGNIAAVVERRLDGFHYVIIDYIATLAANSSVIPEARSDVSEARWVLIDNLVDYDLVKELYQIILKVYRARGHGEAVGLIDKDGQGTDYY